LEAVAATLLELGEEIGGPVGLVFPRIDEQGAGFWAVVVGKGLGEPREEMLDGGRVDGIEHVTPPGAARLTFWAEGFCRTA